jgi:hypothetical protein
MEPRAMAVVEIAEQLRVIAIDPGVQTGYCYASIDNGRLFYYPFQTVDDVDECWKRLENFQPRFIVIEDFEFRRGKQAGGLNLFPVQLIGVARLYALTMGNCATFIQKASQGKSYYTDRVLKEMGLYKRGIPHGLDASRHLLQWATFGPGNKYIGQKHSAREFAMIVDKMDWWRK